MSAYHGTRPLVLPDEAIPLLLLQRAEAAAFGFHYPVSTYLDAVWEALSPGGRAILDVRDATGGGDEVRDRFGNLHDLGPLENGKGRRIGAIKE